MKGSMLLAETPAQHPTLLSPSVSFSSLLGLQGPAQRHQRHEEEAAEGVQEETRASPITEQTGEEEDFLQGFSREARTERRGIRDIATQIKETERASEIAR